MNPSKLPFSKTFLDSYEIIEKLGEGAMGVVFKGRHRDLNRLAAIKCSQNQIADVNNIAARFKREAKYLAALSHPNVVPIYECLVDGDLFILIQEFLSGQSLEDQLLLWHPIPQWTSTFRHIRATSSFCIASPLTKHPVTLRQRTMVRYTT